MGKWVGTIHVHDMPRVPQVADQDRVWECSCGEQFFVSNVTNTWYPVDKKVHKVALDEAE